MIESINAVTLATTNMGRSLRFFADLGFSLSYGGPDATFSSFQVDTGHLNLELRPGYEREQTWGRIVFHVSDVDGLYSKALAAGLHPSTEPRDAGWGERYFHISDPDGHELSFARRLSVTKGSLDESSQSSWEKARDEVSRRATTLAQNAGPKVEYVLARAKPRARDAGRQAVRYAREHEAELKQAASILARYSLRGPLGIAVGAMASNASRQPDVECPSCKAQNPPIARFCNECGKPLTADAADGS